MIFSNKLTDNQIVEKIRKRKNVNKYFSLFYSRYNDKVYNLCYYLLFDKSLTEDIFQETFTSFYKSIAIVKKEPKNPAGYLMNTARNLCLKSNRDKKNYKSLENTIEPAYSMKYEDKYLNDEVLKCINELGQEFKEVIILKEIQGYSHEEIAEICNISKSLSKVRLHRAYKILNDALKPIKKELKKYE